MALTDNPSSSPDPTMSLMRAIDGSHLRWSDFRTIVLGAFRIVLTEGLQLSELARPFSDRLKPSLQKLDRFIPQEREWRSQLATGQGFGSTMVFPPNVIPPTSAHRPLLRCLAPKMSREALPPRTARAQESLFELPAPRPGLLTGFTTSAFNETELSVLPHSTAVTGTIVDFDSGCVSPGTTLYCPFLVFERINAVSEDGVESARNQCAIVGAHCVRAAQLLFRRCNGPRQIFDRPMSFSCAMENSTALINYHFVDADGRYCMSEISRFNLDDADGFTEFQGWIDAIEEWGATHLLPVLKIALRQLLKNNETPPISPMPSLTLSIDTAAGGEEVLMRILRTTFASVKWKCNGGECETPLNSSVAHCGTPLGARKIRAMALSPTSPASDVSNPNAGPTTPFSLWRMRPDWGHRSPVTRRHPLSPLKLRSDMPESPCRPATLSPCTPPPDAPFSAKSPLLVLQKRVDLAMDEIRELRALVETLHGELQVKDHQIESVTRAQGLTSQHLYEHCPNKQADQTTAWESTALGLDYAMYLWRRLPLYPSQPPESWFSSLIWFIFLFLSTSLRHDLWDTLLCLVAVFGDSVVLNV
jgi:hypothetical protein